MASTRGEFIVEKHHGGGMRKKDFHPVVFWMFSIQVVKGNEYLRLRRITGKAVVRWKTKRKKEWEKRNGRR